MIRESYPAARLAAPKVHAYFARHGEHTGGPTGSSAPVPDTDTIERLVNATFWASLRREESYFPKLSMAYLSPEHATDAMVFDRPLLLSASALAKVAPVVERSGIHLGVWHGPTGLEVWGATLDIPTYCFVLELVEPGLLVVKHHRGELGGKYVNVAVLEGDQVKIIDQAASNLPDCPALLTTLLGFGAPGSQETSLNVLVQLAVSMRAHRRGGAMLIVPTGGSAWRESMVAPMAYAVAPAYRRLSALVLDPELDRRPHVWETALREAVDAVAGLTAVDGATVISDTYEVIAFGAKIVRRRGAPPVERVIITEPIEGDRAVDATPAHTGGTRHMSAAQFVHDQQDAVALVASQDGRFTVFVYSPCEGCVHAHRVEALLL